MAPNQLFLNERVLEKYYSNSNKLCLKCKNAVLNTHWLNLFSLGFVIWISGLHRQLLYVTSFIFAGYYLLKRQDYMYAVRDRDMFGYVNSHPEDFPEKGNSSYYKNPVSSLCTLSPVWSWLCRWLQDLYMSCWCPHFVCGWEFRWIPLPGIWLSYLCDSWTGNKIQVLSAFPPHMLIFVLLPWRAGTAVPCTPKPDT